MALAFQRENSHRGTPLPPVPAWGGHRPGRAALRWGPSEGGSAPLALPREAGPPAPRARFCTVAREFHQKVIGSEQRIGTDEGSSSRLLRQPLSRPQARPWPQLSTEPLLVPDRLLPSQRFCPEVSWRVGSCAGVQAGAGPACTFRVPAGGKGGGKGRTPSRRLWDPGSGPKLR